MNSEQKLGRNLITMHTHKADPKRAHFQYALLKIHKQEDVLISLPGPFLQLCRQLPHRVHRRPHLPPPNSKTNGATRAALKDVFLRWKQFRQAERSQFVTEVKVDQLVGLTQQCQQELMSYSFCAKKHSDDKQRK